MCSDGVARSRKGLARRHGESGVPFHAHLTPIRTCTHSPDLVPLTLTLPYADADADQLEACPSFVIILMNRTIGMSPVARSCLTCSLIPDTGTPAVSINCHRF